MRLGVLDVGSNTVHLLVVDAHHGGAPTPAHSEKIELRLSENLTSEGLVSPVATAELVAFVQKAQELAEDKGVAEISGFATSALRDAPNGAEVLNEVADATGVHVELLSGEDEARLTFLAARRWFGWSSGRLLVADIGGGSLEVAVGADEEPDEVMSLPLGAGRLTRDFITNDPPRPKEIRALRKQVRSEVANVVSRFNRLGAPEMAVATSKTFRQLARVTGAAPYAEGPYVRRVLSRDALTQRLGELSAMTAAERAELPGVSGGRAGQLIAGGVVAEAVMDLFDQEQLVLCPWALREGVILRRLDSLAT